MRKFSAFPAIFLIAAVCATSDVFASDPTSKEADVDYRLPSTVSLSGSRSSGDTRSGAIAIRLMLPKNYWVEVSGDRAIELTDGLETKTLGLSGTFGTDPLADYSIDLGADAFGVDSQYTVREGRIRLTAMPTSVFGFDNPGVEVAFEYRGAEFEFANSPNLIFTSNQVLLRAQTYRLEAAFYLLSPWTIRLHTERAELANEFQDLSRPLAPVFIPETAISTAVSWPGQEDGIGISISAKKWSARIGAIRKQAAITEDKTFTASIAADYAWTRKISTGIRYANSKSEDDSTLTPIETVGLDIQLSF
ncbi:MAG: hypothetical protein J0L82_15400 [Deltaproteobacteria bacterium]|nr:hypothetical protein [Deltaproteobacteria bacterium]